MDRLAESANVPATPSVSPYAAARDGASGAGQAQENNGIGIRCDDEEDEAENAEDSNKLENPKEADASVVESQEANGKSEDLKDATDSLDKVKEDTCSSSTEAIKALEGSVEANVDFEELKDLNGSSEELEEENNGNLDKLVELFLDKGLYELKPIKVESQRRVRAALSIIDKMMSSRVVKGGNGANDTHGKDGAQLASIEEEGRTAEVSHDGDPAEVEESCVAEKVELGQETPDDSTGTALEGGNDGSYFPWREELESLVRGGVPMALRGEVQLQPVLQIAAVCFVCVRFDAFMLTYR